MLDFLKKLISSDEKKPVTVIEFGEIPSMLARTRQEAALRFSKGTEGERAATRGAAQQLKAVIKTLLAAQFPEDIHPRLKSTAGKSLPLYAKAIGSALEKPLPEDPAEFYAAAAELLKTCINSAAGQGKYLRVVFPDEMKAAAACVAEIGRAINAMNQPLTEYRTVVAQVDEAERIHTALADIDVDLKKAGEKEGRINNRMEEINERIASCEQTLANLAREKDGADLAEKEKELDSLRNGRDHAIRKYATASMTASHVLRKAEKVARRKGLVSDERAIDRAAALLSDHAMPDTQELALALGAAFSVTKRMIDAGEIVLKNREERSLFSSESSFSGGIVSLCTRCTEQTSAFSVAEQELSSHPVVVRYAEAARELASQKNHFARETEAHNALIQWRTGLTRDIPILQKQLEKVVGEINPGSDVQIHFPDH